MEGNVTLWRPGSLSPSSGFATLVAWWLKAHTFGMESYEFLLQTGCTTYPSDPVSQPGDFQKPHSLAAGPPDA